jgi:hypothetical protein
MKDLEKLEIGARALTAAIPFIGGSINSVWADLSAQRKGQRFMELIDALESDIQVIQDLNKSFITHEDFLDLFENISRHVTIERDCIKRTMYKNLIVNSAKDINANFDKTEKYIRLLENITSNETVYLKIFLNPAKFNEECGNPIVNKNEAGNSHFTYWDNVTVIELLQKLLPKIQTEDILDSLDFLEKNRLVKTNNGADSIKTNGHPIQLLEKKITKKGINFVNYITDGDY